MICVVCGDSFAQSSPPHYVIGVTVVGSESPCVFIGSVGMNTPAENAGVAPGERVLAIDGNVVTKLTDAARLLPSESPKTVTLQLEKDGESHSVTVQRELESTLLHRAGVRIVNGLAVPLDATDAEIKYDLAFDAKRIASHVFPSHYPSNIDLYYPGFELFVLDHGSNIAVGGIESGPASEAGVHWGDLIISVNGTDPRGKSTAQVESMFSRAKPASMTLRINRVGIEKTFTFALAKAASVLRENQLQMVEGHLVPTGMPEKYLYCFK